MLHVSVKEDERKQLCTLIQEVNVQINKKKKTLLLKKSFMNPTQWSS